MLDTIEQPEQPLAANSVRIHRSPSQARLGGERMQNGEGTTVDDAINDISELLAKAYRRYSKLRVVRPATDAIQSTECLDNTGEVSPHGLTLTGQSGHGKESAQ